MTVFGSPSESCSYKFYGTSLTLVYKKTLGWRSGQHQSRQQ